MDKRKIIESTLEIFFFLVGLIVIYQILRKLFGGSWDAENIIVSLVFVNLSATITMTVMTATIRSDLRSLKNQFYSLAADFKKHINDPFAHKK